MVTWGKGGGSKNRHFCSDVLFERPLRELSYIIFVTNNYAPFTCDERKIFAKYQKASKYCDQNCRFGNSTFGPWRFFQTKKYIFFDQAALVKSKFEIMICEKIKLK